MELKKCNNGHSYDPSITPECPECAKLRGKTVPLNADAANAFQDYGKTEPLHKKTEPVNMERKGKWADVRKIDELDGDMDEYTPTIPVDLIKNKEMKNGMPVTGWLVCVEGPCKGMDFKIHSEYNYIGRASSMDICISGDSSISRENHALLAYDSLERAFFFAPSSGGSIVRVNGKAVLGSIKLEAYDRIVIGQSQFLFIPFCGEKFEWE